MRFAPNSVVQLSDGGLTWNDLENTLSQDGQVATTEPATKEWYYSNTALYSFTDLINPELYKTQGITISLFFNVSDKMEDENLNTLFEVRLYNGDNPIGSPQYNYFKTEGSHVIKIGGEYDHWQCQGTVLNDTVEAGNLRVGVRTVGEFYFPIELEYVQADASYVNVNSRSNLNRTPAVAYNGRRHDHQTLPWQSAVLVIPEIGSASVGSVPDGQDGVFYTQDLYVTWTSLLGSGYIPTGFEVEIDVEVEREDEDTKFNYIYINDIRYDLNIHIPAGRHLVKIGGPFETFGQPWDAYKYRAFTFSGAGQVGRKQRQELRIHTVRLNAYTVSLPIPFEIKEELLISGKVAFDLTEWLFSELHVEMSKEPTVGECHTGLLTTSGTLDLHNNIEVVHEEDDPICITINTL